MISHVIASLFEKSIKLSLDIIKWVHSHVVCLTLLPFLPPFFWGHLGCKCLCMCREALILGKNIKEYTIMKKRQESRKMTRRRLHITHPLHSLFFENTELAIHSLSKLMAKKGGFRGKAVIALNQTCYWLLSYKKAKPNQNPYLSTLKSDHVTVLALYQMNRKTEMKYIIQNRSKIEKVR